MHPRAEELIRDLRLAPHPEGGHFGETYRSSRPVRPADEPRDRAALTTIYFLLAAGERSRWHRLDADELWHYYEGDSLELFLFDAPAHSLSRVCLGQVSPGCAPVQVAPAGSWLAARPLGAFTLAGCTMGPGFEEEGFVLMADEPGVAAELAERFPEVAGLI
jgi:hypothetical protein